MRITFCGDIMLGAEVHEFVGTSSVVDWLKGVSDSWVGSDLVIGNLECPCVEEAMPVQGPLPEIIFHAPASRLTELAMSGFSAMTLANNHILDCGPLGLQETIQALDRLGIYHAGAGMNLDEALQPAFIPANGLTIGLVAFCFGPPAGRSTPGVAFFEPRLMRKALALARSKADLVIAVLHDGLEYSDVPPTETRNRFIFLAENGADIVVGHHPHVLQGLEWCNNVPIAYSLGDLLFHNALDYVAKRNFSRIAMGCHAPEEVRRDTQKFGRGAILRVDISKDEKSTSWHPFRQGPNLRPQLSAGHLLEEDFSRLAELSTALLDPTDPRHALSDLVLRMAQRENWNDVQMQEILHLALRPKWRYIPRGLHWLKSRFYKAVRCQ